MPTKIFVVLCCFSCSKLKVVTSNPLESTYVNSYSSLVSTIIHVTRHEKTMLMYTKYTSLHYFNYLTFCVSYISSVIVLKFPIVGCSIS